MQYITQRGVQTGEHVFGGPAHGTIFLTGSPPTDEVLAVKDFRPHSHITSQIIYLVFFLERCLPRQNRVLMRRY